MAGKKYTLLFVPFFMVLVFFSASAAADTGEYDIETFRGVFSEIIKDPTIAGMIGNERINIFVDGEIKGHVITRNSELAETGEDELSDPTLNVYAGSETIQNIIDGETTFLDAFREGKIRLEGVGFFNALRFAIAQFLFNLYSFFGGVPDSDGDGLDDRMDGCPNEAGPRANDGCPYGDYDDDGLTDDVDECLDRAGPTENNGCPVTDCNDNDPCTIDSYESSTGRCKNVPKDCDDGDPCTFEGCDPMTGTCSYVTMVCGDDDPCTLDSCDRGECMHMQRDCSDGNPDTYDYCEPSTGNCSHVPLDDKCALADISIEGAVINELSKNMKLFVDYRGNFDQQFGAYLDYFGTNYAWFFDAKADTFAEVTIPEDIILGTAGPDPLQDVSKVTVISPQCQSVNDSVDSSWITKKSQYCRYADASIEGARYDDTSDELVLSVNNSGDVDLNFAAYLQYAGSPVTYAWFFETGENTLTDVTMSEMFRDLEPLELIGREVSWVTVTGMDCQIGEYRFEEPDIAG